MKKIIKPLLVIGSITLMIVSCSKNDEPGTLEKQLTQLKAVNFPDNGDEVLQTKTNRELGNGKKELIQVVKKSMPIDPVELVDVSNLEVIYPGSILRGDSFMEGGLDPVALVNPKEITISISLQGKGFEVKKSTTPSVSNISQQMIDFITNDNLNADSAPTYLNYYTNSVESYASFNKSFRTHARASGLFGLAKKSFNYETSELSINHDKYVLIKVRQFFYNIAVDPKPYDQWGDLDNTNLGTHEPVYISSVDYGRVAHLLIKTHLSVEAVHKKISGAVSLGLPIIMRGNGSVENNEEYNSFFTSNEIKVVTLGGPLKYGNVIHDYKSFIEFLYVPTTRELIESAVPIAYKVRTLKDNKEVQVRTFYTEQRVVRE